MAMPACAHATVTVVANRRGGYSLFGSLVGVFIQPALGRAADLQGFGASLVIGAAVELIRTHSGSTPATPAPCQWMSLLPPHRPNRSHPALSKIVTMSNEQGNSWPPVRRRSTMVFFA